MVFRFLQSIMAFVCWLLSSYSGLLAAPPNFLVIVADDLGYSDLGCYGGEIETPNLDRLAAGGLRFTQFYNTGRCWPTRASILTGYYPHQIGRDALPNVPGGASGRRPAWAKLLPQRLAPLGYRSYMSGKWHVDGMPHAQGFDKSFTMDDHNRFFYPQKTTRDDRLQPPVERGSDYYQTTAIAEHAIECLRDHASSCSEKPFFQYLAFTCPHFPLMAPASDIAKYAGRYAAGWDQVREERWGRIQALGLMKGGLSELEPSIGPPYHFASAIEQLGAKEVNRELPWDSLSDEQRAFQAAKMEIHAAMVDRMDVEIGRVIEQLEAMDALENTLILFLSDNGASAEIMIRGDGHDASAPLGSADSYLCLGPGWSSAANTPFRRHKTWAHEGGVATPFIVHWPAGFESHGELREQVGHVVDIAPTLVHLAGGEWVTDESAAAIQGINLVEFLKDRDATVERSVWWYHEGNRGIRKGDFKLVAAKDEAWQLYNLGEDRSEMSDVATGLSEKAAELQQEWEAITSRFEETALQNVADAQSQAEEKAVEVPAKQTSE